VENLGTTVTSGVLFGTPDGPGGGYYTAGCDPTYGLALNCNRSGSGDVYVDTLQTCSALGFQSGSGTWMAWVRWDGALGSEDHMIFGNPTADSIHYGIRANGGGVNDAHFGTWGGDIGDAGTIPIGTWTHMTFMQDGAVGRVFINGVQSAAAGYGINGNTAAKAVLIGTHPNGVLADNSFNGVIDEVKIFDRPLITSEVVAAMAAPPTGPVELDLVITPAALAGANLTIDVNGVPAGQTFHLRSSNDGVTFTPIGFDFDSTTVFPTTITVDPGATPRAIYQAWTGPSIP
jgi:hypothetical protein